MPNERKAYEGHYVTPSGELTYDHDRFRCDNIGEHGAWADTPWLVFNYCPFCGQELGERLYDPPQEEPPEGI